MSDRFSRKEIKHDGILVLTVLKHPSDEQARLGSIEDFLAKKLLDLAMPRNCRDVATGRVHIN